MLAKHYSLMLFMSYICCYSGKKKYSNSFMKESVILWCLYTVNICAILVRNISQFHS